MKVLVIGDIMLDVYKFGKVNRISPEAPVPVVDINYIHETLGGAANTALNIAKVIGSENVTLVGDVGNDAMGDIVRNKLFELNILCSLSGQHFTTVKERVFADGQQLIRLDEELTDKIHYKVIQKLVVPNLQLIPDAPNFEEALNDFDCIVVADYDKGIVTEGLMEALKPHGYKLIIDPKPENVDLYCRHILSTPNEKEYRLMNFDTNASYDLVTKGSKGAVLLDKINNLSIPLPVRAIPDGESEVIGAGDTVTAIMAIMLSNRGYHDESILGQSEDSYMIRSAKVAIECARYVVTKQGTAFVPEDVFKRIYKGVNDE
jgi:bifunctional ADP-heptose synthase (sugar kinase/adenylyltransferase)